MQTTVIHADDEVGHKVYSHSGDVSAAIHPSTTFAADNTMGLTYSRSGGVNTARVETVLGALEGGYPAVVFGSGLAASEAALHAALKVGSGSRIVLMRGYHGSRLVAEQIADRSRGGVEVVEGDDVEDAVAEGEIELGAGDVVWVETPSNPFNTVVDVGGLAGYVGSAGAMLVVDATFATPYTLRALECGADIVVHSATKYLGGHSDVLAGVAAAARDELAECLRASRTVSGAVLGALETWLLLRSLRTFPLRMRTQCENAAALAAAVEDAGLVERVWHPSLESHPTHARAVASMTNGFGAVVTLNLGSKERAEAFVDGLQLFVFATSLGGVESMVDIRARWDSGIAPGVVRLSVGVEESVDLVEDVMSALRASSSSSSTAGDGCDDCDDCDE